MKNRKQVDIENKFSYDIDYEIFTTEEIIKIINFYNLVVKYSKNKLSYTEFINAYNEYRNIINSISLEKKYNKSFYEKTGLSIYHLVNRND